MKDLIERLEKATGPDRALDHTIALALGWKWHPRAAIQGQSEWTDADGNINIKLPCWTASLDAAMTLAKPGDYDFSLTRTTRGGEAFTEWQARVALDTVEDDPDETGPQALGEGRTAPLACCIAFLKAHSRSVEEPKE